MKEAVLDSYALISYLEREEGYEEVARIFDECVAKDREVFVCVVNWGEVFYHALRAGAKGLPTWLKTQCEHCRCKCSTLTRNSRSWQQV
jgi:predicted nucleic acid-binding protein